MFVPARRQPLRRCAVRCRGAGARTGATPQKCYVARLRAPHPTSLGDSGRWSVSTGSDCLGRGSVGSCLGHLSGPDRFGVLANVE